MILDLEIVVSHLIKGLRHLFLSLCDLLLIVAVLDLLLLLFQLRKLSVLLLSIGFKVLLVVALGIGLAEHRNMSLDSECLGLMREYSFKVPFSISILDEVKDSLGGGGGACLGVPEIEGVEVKDVIGRSFSLKGLENACGLLVESLSQDVIEEEGLHEVDRVFDQLLTVLFVQESIEDAQISHMFLLRVAGVSKTCQSLLKEVLGWKC